jgi:hypothetical protein
MPKENGYFQYCLELVAKKANLDPVSQWTNGNYILLSEELFAESGHRIHRNTLKMLYGKSIIKDYEPDAEILNAFAKYLGFEHYRDFRNSAKLESLIGPQYVSTGSAFPFLTTPLPVLENEETEEEEKPSYRWLVAFFMLIIILSAFIYWKTKRKEETLLNSKSRYKYVLKVRIMKYNFLNSTDLKSSFPNKFWYA